jgi:hypothetical protein
MPAEHIGYWRLRFGLLFLIVIMFFEQRNVVGQSSAPTTAAPMTTAPTRAPTAAPSFNLINILLKM